MKFSIVTISKNQGKFIEQNIKSVLKQNYKNYEHIIVDCVSNDETHKIIKKYKSNNLKIIIEKDKGPADGINKGFALATGDIYYF
jgi:glycosyltransferase involved in cell wall biosynthesis